VYIVHVGILELLLPQLITFLTWLVLFISASALILIISVGMGRLLGEFLDVIVGWFR
jgi:hypothetical protein